MLLLCGKNGKIKQTDRQVTLLHLIEAAFCRRMNVVRSLELHVLSPLTLEVDKAVKRL